MPTMEKLTSITQRLRYKYFSNFIFIDINKSGGSSVEKALGIPFAHITARERIQRIGIEQWNKKFTFTIVRNPWDRVVSHYHYRVMTNQTQLATKKIDFNEWVALAYGQKDPEYYDKPKLFMPQLEWIIDESGIEVVDYIGRFESLQADFAEICKRLGRPEIVLPHLKKSSRKPFRDYYSSKSIDIVGNWFSKDITRFNYNF